VRQNCIKFAKGVFRFVLGTVVFMAVVVFIHFMKYLIPAYAQTYADGGWPLVWKETLALFGW
jgi:type II secretory pathway component PulF